MSGDGQTQANKWAIGFLASIFVTLVGLGCPGLLFIGRVTGSVERLNADVGKMAQEVSDLSGVVVADIRERMLVMDQRLQVVEGSQPESEQRINDLERLYYDLKSRRETPTGGDN